MKKIIILFAAVLSLVLCACSEKDKSVVGKWADEETGNIVEYTEDGYYYEYQNENFTTDKTMYKISGDKICYYLEGELPETGFEVPFGFDEEGNLVRYLKDENQIYIPHTDKNTEDGDKK